MKANILKTVLLLLISFFVVDEVDAQQSTKKEKVKPIRESKWKRSLQAGFYYNQSSFSDSWKGGGVNTIAWNGLVNSKASYTDDKFNWTNDIQLQYGQNNTKDIGVRKNFDRLFFESKASYKLKGAWNAFAALSFLSQFEAGYKYEKKMVDGSDSIVLISEFMAPAYVTEAFGLEYKPAEYFSLQFGFASFRQTFVINQDLYKPEYTSSNILYGVNKGDYYRNQIVFQFIGNYDKEIFKNITLKARYMLVVDYKQPDHEGIINRLDASLVAKINKLISVNFGTIVLYDYTQIDELQYSQLLGVGMLFSFSNFEEKK